MMNKEKYIDGYQKLAGAITVQAVHDFRKAVKHLAKGKGNLAMDVHVIKEVIAFVKSDWFTTLTNMQPEIVLKKLQEEVDQNGIRDNSTESYFRNKEKLNETGQKICKVIIDIEPDQATIIDDAYGMNLNDFKRSIILDSPPDDKSGRSENGR